MPATSNFPMPDDVLGEHDGAVRVIINLKPKGATVDTSSKEIVDGVVKLFRGLNSVWRRAHAAAPEPHDCSNASQNKNGYAHFDV